MASSPYPSRSISGLKRDTGGIPKNKINEILVSLTVKNYVEKTEIAKNEFRWHLTK